MTIEITKRYSYSPSEIAILIANDIELKHEEKVNPKSIRWSVDSGDPGGYGSYGDPAHVYNSPTPASFNGCEVTIVIRK